MENFGENSGFELETRILLRVHQLLSDAWMPVMKLMTDLGSVIILGVICAVTVWSLVKHEQTKQAWIVAASFAVATVMGVAIKCAVDRPRPQLWEHTPEFGSSFPSGHTLRAVVIYGVLAYLIGARHPRLKSVVWLVWVVLVAMIGFSRLYLGVHWPSDVLASGLLGMIVLGIVLRWQVARSGQAPSNTGAKPNS